MRGTNEPAGPGTRSLLDAFATGDPDSPLPLGRLFEGLGDRAFGMLLVAAAAPAFIPVPGLAGGLSGPLVTFVGLQLLLRLPQPWLPRFLARRGPQRRTLGRLRDRLSPWLARLERVVRPRATALLDHWLPGIVTGALVIAIGVLLTLPIPFTNYLFGVLVLLFALAFLERDGVLMAVAWGAGLVAIGGFAAISGGLVRSIAGWF